MSSSSIEKTILFLLSFLFVILLFNFTANKTMVDRNELVLEYENEFIEKLHQATHLSDAYRAFYLASSKVERDEFEAFSDALNLNLPIKYTVAHMVRKENELKFEAIEIKGEQFVDSMFVNNFNLTPKLIVFDKHLRVINPINMNEFILIQVDPKTLCKQNDKIEIRIDDIQISSLKGKPKYISKRIVLGLLIEFRS